jgi:rhomboid protease GluP
MHHTGDNNGAVSTWLCLNYEDFKKGQIWRMFTLVYSHYGFEHILFNMPAIFFSGRYIESKYGSFKTLLIFEGSAFFVSVYACILSINSTFSGFGGSSLGIYALLIIFMFTLFQKGQTSKPHRYEVVYVILYFVLGNIPGIGVMGDSHLHSFLFGLIVFCVIAVYTKSNNTSKG